MIVVVCSAVIQRKGAFLVVKEFKPSAAGKFGLPGGKLEQGETVVDCIKREVQEETGFTVTSAELIRIVNKPHTHEGNTLIKFIFNCTITDEPTGPAEHECEFLPTKDLHALQSRGLIRGDEIVPLLESMDSTSEDQPFLQLYS